MRPTVEKPAVPEVVEVEQRAPEPRRRWRSRLLSPLPALIALAVVMAALAVFFAVRASALDDTAVRANSALTDNAGTSKVVGQVTAAVNGVFSYDYSNPGKTDEAVRKSLVGRAVQDYDKLIQPVKKQAATDKLVLTVATVATGVEVLSGDRARVLVFVDQKATRTDNNQTSSGGGQLVVDAVLGDGSWRISGITAY